MPKLLSVDRILGAVLFLVGCAELHAGFPVATTSRREASYTVAVPRLPYGGGEDELRMSIVTSEVTEQDRAREKVFGNGFQVTRSITGSLNGRRFMVPERALRNAPDIEIPQRVSTLQLARGGFSVVLFGGEGSSRYALYLDFKAGIFRQARVKGR